jgi:hypothetical protein
MKKWFANRSRKVGPRRRLAIAIASLFLFVVLSVLAKALAPVAGVSDAVGLFAAAGVIALCSLIVLAARRSRG